MQATGNDQNEADLFADMVASLTREVPAPQMSVKERRAILDRAAGAFLRAAAELAAFDGVCVREVVDKAAAFRSENLPAPIQAPALSEEYAKLLYARRAAGASPVIRSHPDIADPDGAPLFAFGRHGLPTRPARLLPHEIARMSESLVAMVADLELLAVAARRAASGKLSQVANSRMLLAGALVRTFDTFGLTATGSPEGFAAHCMRKLLDARGDRGSGLQALQKAVAAARSENGREK